MYGRYRKTTQEESAQESRSIKFEKLQAGVEFCEGTADSLFRGRRSRPGSDHADCESKRGELRGLKMNRSSLLPSERHKNIAVERLNAQSDLS
jgi:hypothetical protein